MIYFFDNELNMVKVITSKNVISAVHEHELNGLILGTVEADLSYTEAFINDVDYFGYYYKDNYYLHKIKRVEHEHENELIRITGRHIFFEDMLYGDYIRDVRPENRDALYILNQTISANTRWQTVMTDTSKVHTTNYYWVPPMEVLNDLTENVGIEYEPRILFDGQKINGFQLHVANRIGEDTPIRVPFGSRVVSLKHEVDYSEIVTALYGHGKGEEVGDGYGRRINFRDIDFSRNGVVSRPGSLFMENPDITAQYGKDDGSPKFGRIVFEDIEDEQELAEATYETYLEQSRPKMLFEASVADLGDVGMGDGVLIIRREYDVYFNARIHKLMVDLLDAENAEVELGDYAHFKESKVQRKTRESNNQYRRETSSRIQQLKEQFNDRFDGEVNQMREEYEQALIDAHAEIQAAEERMTELIGDERASLQTEIDSKVSDAREYADSQIADKEAQYIEDWDARDADIQRTIETVVGGNVDELDTNLLDVNSRLFQTHNDLIERINNIDTQSFNLIRGSRFDEPASFNLRGGAYVVDDEGDIPFVRLGDAPNNIPFVQFSENVRLEEDQQYTLTVEYRTEDVSELDYLRIFPVSGGNSNLITFADNNAPYEIQTDGTWHRMIFRFTPTFSVDGGIGIGTNFVSGDETRGVIDIRLPYLTDGNNTQWVFHPSDNYSSIATVMQRLGDFEGYIEDNKEMILGELEDTREDLTQRLSAAQADIDNLNFETRNLLPLVRSAWEDGGIWSSGNLSGHSERLRTAAVGSLTPGEHYTLSDNSAYLSAINAVEIFIYNDGVFVERFEIERLGSLSFQATGNEYRIQLTPLPGFSIHLDYMEHPDERIKIKLERGTKRSEFTYAPEDTRHKIIQLDDSFEFIDGELEGMLRRTEIEPINDKITEFETNFEANAETLGLLQEKTELHDGEITTWSNLTESTADEVSRVLTRVSDTEDGLERAETDISLAAGEIEAALSRITVTEGDITEANAVIEANAEGLSALLTRTTNAEEAIADISIDVEGITADFASYKEDVDGEVGALSAQVASYEASVDGFRAEVGTLQGDIDDVDTWIADKGAVIDGTAEAISARVWMDDVKGIGANLIPMSEPSWESGGIWTTGNLSGESDRIRLRDVIPIREGQYYTFSDDSTYDSRIESIRVFVYKDGETVLYESVPRRGQVTFFAEGDALRVSLVPMSGFSIPLSMISEADERFKMKLEVGDEATPMMDALAQLEKHTDFVLRSDGFFLGGNYVGGEHYSTAIVGSANGIDILAEEMRLTGDLLVKGDVEAWSMAAVKAEFGSLWADEFEAITIKGDHIDGDTITGSHLRVDKAMVDKLVADNAFIDDIKSLSIDAVYADLRSVDSEIMSSNIIRSNWLRVDTALFERFTSSEAFIERLEVKAGNIRDLTGIHIRGGMLDSLNGATRLNLNTGDWTIGGNAQIEFTDSRNTLFYTYGGRTSGIGVSYNTVGNSPAVVMGTVEYGSLLTSETRGFSGFIANTRNRERADGIQNSVTGNNFQIRDNVAASEKVIEFRLNATSQTARILPWNTGNYFYHIGYENQRFDRAYIDSVWAGGGALLIRNQNSNFSQQGWQMDVAYSGESYLTFRGRNSNDYFNLGAPGWRFSFIYSVNSLQVSSDKRLKDNIRDNPLGLDFINDIQTREFSMLNVPDEDKGTMKTGIIAQELLPVLQKHGIDTDSHAMVTMGADGYYGAQYEQLIIPTIRAVQEVDAKVETNITTLASHESRIETTEEKIKRLEKEIELLKGA